MQVLLMMLIMVEVFLMIWFHELQQSWAESWKQSNNCGHPRFEIDQSVGRNALKAEGVVPDMLMQILKKATGE